MKVTPSGCGRCANWWSRVRSANRASFSFLKAMEAIEHLEQDLATQAMQDLPDIIQRHLFVAGTRTALERSCRGFTFQGRTHHSATCWNTCRYTWPYCV